MDMSSRILEVLTYAVLPVLSGTLGAALSAFRQPSPGIRSGVQHFAAGVVFAVVGVEFLPDILHRHRPLPVMAGFTLGIATLLLIRSLSTARETPSNPKSGTLPIAFLFAMGIDMLIDGSLIGLGFVAGVKKGKLLVAAIAVELLSLGIATIVTLTDAGVARTKAVVVTSLEASIIFVGAALGGTVLRGLSDTSVEFALSFGLSVLLFLVVEELLVEAHSVPETPLITSSFFAGFLLFLMLGMVE
jgi:ZIP family zinc transporter